MKYDETEKIYAERLSEELKRFDFKMKRNKIIRNPEKITFNPLEAEIQDLYYYMICNTSLWNFLRRSSSARFELGFALYLILVFITLVGYIIYNASSF